MLDLCESNFREVLFLEVVRERLVSSALQLLRFSIEFGGKEVVSFEAPLLFQSSIDCSLTTIMSLGKLTVP